MKAHLKERLLILNLFLLYPSNSGTCCCLSNSHHQTVIQYILPAALLFSLPLLNLSLSLASSHFWQKCALLSFTVWRRNAQNPFWLPSFYPAFSAVAMNSHSEFFLTDLILYPVQSDFSLEISSFQIQWSTPPPLMRCSYFTFTAPLHLFLMLLLTSSLPLLFVFWSGIQHISLFFQQRIHSIFCLCPFSFSFHTFHTTLKLQPTQIFWAE